MRAWRHGWQGFQPVLILLAACWAAGTAAWAARPDAQADSQLRQQALAGLRRAAEFFTRTVATEGGYLYAYSEDLSRREGEREASATTVWVQPPGTPSVGLALLRAWEVTGDSFYLDAAAKAAQALVRGQLISGGWDYEINFAPADRKKKAYRVPPNNPQGMNVTTLDDNTTQEALRLLMRLDRALAAQGKTDSSLHEAVAYALESLLQAQYPNGAWPQRYSKPPERAKFPVLAASYPDAWDRTWPGTKYTGYYTFNDNALDDVIDIMLEASRLYEEPKYRAAAQRGGDFIILAQMPDPQPAWAQQYDAQMHPAWARKFEPPAITGGESQSILLELLDLYRATGNEKYLQPIPRALDYLQASLLGDGRLARFYELKTNKPLYFTRDYRLTYSDSDPPTHYTFKMDPKLARIRREYEKLKATPAEKLNRPAKRKPQSPGAVSTAKTKAVLAELDDRGRWLETGRLKTDPAPGGGDEPIIRSATFIKNVMVLCNCLEQADPRQR